MNSNNDWEQAVAFHGHTCAGLAIGYRAARAAREHLKFSRSPDEELVAIVETDNCALDALQVMLGCSMGKGNIFFRDYGKNVFTIGRRDTGQAVRIAFKGFGRIRDDESQSIRLRVLSGTASREDKDKFRILMARETQRVLDMDDDELFNIEEINLEFPSKARIFTSHPCSVCGEEVMEPRLRIKEGKPVCIPCGDYYPSRI